MEDKEKIGVTIALRPQAIIDFKDKILPALLSHIKEIPLPNFSEANYDLTNIVVNELQIPVDQIGIKLSGGSIIASSSGLRIKISLNIKATLPFGFKVNVNTIATASNSDVSFRFRLEHQSQETKITIEETIVDAKNIYVQLSGTLGYVASAFANTIAPLLKNRINSKIKTVLHDAIQEELNHLISKIDLSAEIPGTYIKADYHLMKTPTVTPEFLSFQFYGKFYNTKKPNLYNEMIANYELPSIDEERMDQIVQFFIADHVIDSLLYSVFTAGYLKVKIDQSMIPADIEYQLNTSSLNMLFNGVEDTFGEEEPVILCLEANDTPPVLRMKSGIIEGEITGTIDVQVSEKDIWKTAIVLATTVAFEGNLDIKSFIVRAELKKLRFLRFKVIESKIPDIEEEILSDVFNTIVMWSLDSINQKLFSNGFPLPSIPYTNLESIEILMKEGYLKVGATPIIDPDIKNLLT